MNKRISLKTFLLRSILQHKEKPQMKSSLVDSSYPLLIKWLFVTNIPTQISNQVAQSLHCSIWWNETYTSSRLIHNGSNCYLQLNFIQKSHLKITNQNVWDMFPGIFIHNINTMYTGIFCTMMNILGCHPQQPHLLWSMKPN